jgi:hypothetical protein
MMYNENDIRSILSAKPFVELPTDAKIFQMAEWGCEELEMAIMCDISTDDLLRDYTDVILKGRVKGMMELRQVQHQEAVLGAKPMMLKHLGAHRLKQIDALIVNTNAVTQGLSISADASSLTREQLLALLSREMTKIPK